MEETNQKGIWRPLNAIRAKVIGIAKYKNQLLVAEVLDDQGNLKGWCPLGGGIEFGETAEQALKREIFEELGCSLSIRGNPAVCENIFEHEGSKGHEIIFAFPIQFHDSHIYAKKRFQIHEDRGSIHLVEWRDSDSFQSGKVRFFPPALINQLLTFPNLD